MGGTRSGGLLARATGIGVHAEAYMRRLLDPDGNMREHYSTTGADEARGIGERLISLVPAVHRTRGG